MPTNLNAGAPQNRVSRYSIPAVLGALLGLSSHSEIITGQNSQGQVAQVSTITVDSASDDTQYTATVQGVDVTVDSGTSATTTTIAEDLAAALTADAFVGAWVTVAASTSTIVLTARRAGDTFSVAVDAGLSVALTAAAVSVSAIPHGRALFSDGTRNPDGLALNVGLPAGFSAQEDLLSYTYSAAAVVSVSVEIGGSVYSTPAIVMDTDEATTSAAIAAALNAVLPSDTVLAAADGDDLSLTAEVAGASFLTSYSMSAPATTLPELTSSRSLSTSMADAFTGIVVRNAAVQSLSLTTITSEVPPNAPCDLLTRGTIWVARDPAQTPGWRGAVYCDAAGLLYTEPGAGLVHIPQLSWELSATADLALVRVAV